MEKTKLITIEYEEYLDLLSYREMIQEAKKESRTETTFSPSIDPHGYTRQQITATKLFDKLASHNKVNSIEIVRGK